MATDIDGPGNNDIVYAISAVQPEWNDWVQIDQSGVIEVLLDKKINCDIPKIDSFRVRIHLTDGELDTYGEVFNSNLYINQIFLNNNIIDRYNNN